MKFDLRFALSRQPKKYCSKQSCIRANAARIADGTSKSWIFSDSKASSFDSFSKPRSAGGAQPNMPGPAGPIRESFINAGPRQLLAEGMDIHIFCCSPRMLCRRFLLGVTEWRG